MTIFTAPNLFADFTGTSGTNSFIYKGAPYPDFNSWLTAISGTFTRASTAYYYNASGVLVSAANNVARFDHNPVTFAANGIILEQASTNLNVFSDLSSGYSVSGGATLTFAAGPAPDGSSNASNLIQDNTNTFHGVGQGTAATVSNGPIYTASAFVRPIFNQRWIVLRIDGGAGNFANGYSYFDLVNGVTGTLGAGATSANITKITGGYYRIQVTGVSAGTSAQIFIYLSNADNQGTVPSFTGDGISGIGTWGWQLENLSFASSYIPTAASTVSRSADTLSATPISNWYNTANGALLIAADTALPGSSTPSAGSITDGGSNNITVSAASGGTLGDVSSTGANQFVPQVGSNGQIAYTANVKSVAAFSAQAGNFAYVRDGLTVFSQSSGIMPVTPNTLYIGNNNGGAQINGHIYQIGYWPNTFTAAQLQTLTSSTLVFDLSPTNLTNRAGKYFSRKDYAEWLARIVGENEISRLEYELFVSEAERDRNLTDIERAIRDHEDAATQFGASEVALFNNLTTTNHIKYSEAKEKLERARKERDHHYYMEVVKKEWAKHKGR